jgi:para-aminobenzoate synthetase component 1
LKSKLLDYIANNGLQAFKRLCYVYTQGFSQSCVLDSCQLNTGVNGGKYELIAAFGAQNTYRNMVEIQRATEQKKWLFGALGYDLKNQFEKLESNNSSIINTENLLFFEPKTMIILRKNGELDVLGDPLQQSFWNDKDLPMHRQLSCDQLPTEKETYIEKIETIHELIRAGEVYELNYCVPHTRTFTHFSPSRFQLALIKTSPVPMASYLKADHIHLCGASMERYLLKDGNKLISQPIKGTIRKGISPQEDEKLIADLENSEKDRAENVMIVDLVRNDLNKICERGSVHVTELFGIYSYLQVHQMISTVEGTVDPAVNLTQILEASFPMGSMTGTPKIAAMQYIETLEHFKRGWYSGAVGYITPDGNFDFNVVIRSVLCDMHENVLNYNAGGAITIDSEAESEWNEVQLKTKAITQILGD